MQDTGASNPFVPVFGFQFQMARFTGSYEIWLALDDSDHDSRRSRNRRPLKLETVTALELERYHKQLFYWLLVRFGPCVFPSGIPLEEGVPIPLQSQN
jgi:hypothetical protein